QWPSRYGPGDQGYDLDLYVYGADGKLAGKSEMWMFSMGEGVWLQNPRNGPYRVVVVPKTVVGDLPYRVVVDLHRGYTLRESDVIYVGPSGKPDRLPYPLDLRFVPRPPVRHR